MRYSFFVTSLLLSFLTLVHCNKSPLEDSSKKSGQDLESVQGTYSLEPSSRQEVLYLDGNGSARYHQDITKDAEPGFYTLEGDILRIYLKIANNELTGIFVKDAKQNIWKGRWQGAFRLLRKANSDHR